MSDLKALIDELLALRPTEEFALFYDPKSRIGLWSVDFVNSDHCAGLGEVGGEFTGDGETPDAAVRQCIENVKAGRHNI